MANVTRLEEFLLNLVGDAQQELGDAVSDFAADALPDALDSAFAGDVAVPQRAHLDVPVPGGDDATLLLMPAWAAGRSIGVKIATVFPDNARRSLPAVLASYFLMNGETGEPLAVLDGTELTVRRTAAASALASRYLSRQNARTLLMVGTGNLAPHLVRAHAAARPIDHVIEPYGAGRHWKDDKPPASSSLPLKPLALLLAVEPEGQVVLGDRLAVHDQRALLGPVALEAERGVEPLGGLVLAAEARTGGLYYLDFELETAAPHKLIGVRIEGPIDSITFRIQHVRSFL